jgi:3-dehydroquinate synthase
MAVGVSQNLSELTINSSFGAYQIKFQSVSEELSENAFFLIDNNLKGSLDLNNDKSIYVEAIEKNKTLNAVENAMIQLSEKGMTKKNDLVVIGGGYLQDIGTLVASLYMRGIDWTYVPTTLAAMGDSCIGGKSSINAGHVKNLVGNFYPPRQVLVDVEFISTLPNLEVIAGISEIIKICFARSYKTFIQCSKLISDWKEDSNPKILTEIIQLSLESKKYFVEEDEFDSGIRKLLNFGHSFGHALESASDYKIPHGVAVLIGMIAASQHPRSLATEETNTLVINSLAFSKVIGKEIAVEISNLNFERFATALSKDKKNTSSDLVLILPSKVGLEIVSIPFDRDALGEATKAMKAGIEMVLNEIR